MRIGGDKLTSVALSFCWIVTTVKSATVPTTSPTTTAPPVTTTTTHTTTTTAPPAVSTTTTSPTTVNTTSMLACYDCTEAFKYVWEPFTECQAYPTTAPLRECLDVERYCKVERTTYKSMTVTITRACSKECWYGCHASGFGLTKLKCTSCCTERGCNTDNGNGTLQSPNIAFLSSIYFVVYALWDNRYTKC